MAKCPVCGIPGGTEEEGSYHAVTPHNKSKAEQERVAKNLRCEKRQDSTDRRARLHRALDCVLDRAGAKDALHQTFRLQDPRGGGQGRKVDDILRSLGFNGSGGRYANKDGGTVVFREGAMGRSTLTLSDVTRDEAAGIELRVDNAGMLV